MKTIKIKQLRFVRHYLEIGNATEAAIRAGYNENSAGQVAYRLLQKKHIQDLILEQEDEYFGEQKRRFARLANLAQDALEQVTTEGKGMARVIAANSILDRAGHKPVDKIESTVNATVEDVTINDARNSLLAKLTAISASSQNSGSDTPAQ